MKNSETREMARAHRRENFSRRLAVQLQRHSCGRARELDGSTPRIRLGDMIKFYPLVMSILSET